MAIERYDRYPPYGPDPKAGLTEFQKNTTRFAPDPASKPKSCAPPKESGEYWVKSAHWAEYAPELGWHTQWMILTIEVDPHTGEARFETEDRGSFPWCDDESVTVEVRSIVGWKDSPVVSSS